MTFTLNERPGSRSSTTVPASTTLKFVANGEFDGATVHAFALAMTPAIYMHPIGALLYRQDLAIDPVGFKVFNVDVPYSEKKHDTGSVQLSFDTTGGTVHITASKQTVAAYGSANFPNANINDHKQAIGVNSSGEIDGADVIIPVLKLTATFRHPQGAITLAQIKNLARWTGKVNSDSFLTFAPGEALFLGCTGQEGTDQPTEIQYHFACSENLTGLSVGGITVANKLGHDHYWIQFMPTITQDQKRSARIPGAVYVERVYDRIPLATSLGFGY